MSTQEAVPAAGARVLVTGAGGRLGGRLAELLAPRFRVTAGIRASAAPGGLPAIALDASDAGSVAAALAATRCTSVVHCAAMADADACERDPDAAARLNEGACRTLADACATRGVRLVALSTDLVLSGERPYWSEDDPALPASVYGRTKLAGERAVLEAAETFAVVRVALVAGRTHGPHPSATEAIAWALDEGRPLRLFTDQYRTPVDPESVADALTALVAGGPGGLYHLGGPERLSRFELGQRVAGVLGLDPRRIEPVRQADHPSGAPRPADVSLDARRARDRLGWRPRDVDDAIRAGRPRRG
ncbi:MAG: SDR family oxidoreductase [Vicinamibacteria bacterium]